MFEPIRRHQSVTQFCLICSRFVFLWHLQLISDKFLHHMCISHGAVVRFCFKENGCEHMFKLTCELDFSLFKSGIRPTVGRKENSSAGLFLFWHLWVTLWSSQRLHHDSESRGVVNKSPPHFLATSRLPLQQWGSWDVRHVWRRCRGLARPVLWDICMRVSAPRSRMWDWEQSSAERCHIRQRAAAVVCERHMTRCSFLVLHLHESFRIRLAVKDRGDDGRCGRGNQSPVCTEERQKWRVACKWRVCMKEKGRKERSDEQNSKRRMSQSAVCELHAN